jgi:hypothetical protein
VTDVMDLIYEQMDCSWPSAIATAKLMMAERLSKEPSVEIWKASCPLMGASSSSTKPPGCLQLHYRGRLTV